MQFAINYSPQAEQLLTEGEIELDLFKCPDWENLVSAAEKHRPVYVHFPLMIGCGQIETLDLTTIESWLNRTDTRFVNVHLLPNRAQFPEGASLADVLAGLVDELQILTRAFGAERVIVENIPYQTSEIERHTIVESVQPALMRDLLAATGAGLLLDIGHALLTCNYLDWAVDDYFQALPMHALREVHVTGLGTHQHTGNLTDHLAMQASDWQRLEWCFEHIQRGEWSRPQILAFEYGGIGPHFDWRCDISVIREQVPRLYALTQSVGTQSQGA